MKRPEADADASIERGEEGRTGSGDARMEEWRCGWRTTDGVKMERGWVGERERMKQQKINWKEHD